MRHGHPRAELGRRAVLGAVATGVAGCAIGERGAPVPDADVRAATVLGLPNERFCVADPVDLPRIVEEFNQAGRRQRRYFGLGPRDPLPPSSIIAFSDGGGVSADLAAGVGFSCGAAGAGLSACATGTGEASAGFAATAGLNGGTCSWPGIRICTSATGVCGA